MHSNLKQNTIFNMIKVVAQLIFPLITFPYISRVLGTTGVGKVNYASSVNSYLSLIATLSISTYAIRECSIIRNNRKKLNKIASQIFTINLYSTLVAYIVMFIVICIPKFQTIQNLIIINSFNMIFGTLGADWINNTFEDFKYITLRTVMFQILSLILMFLFVHNPSDYVKYVIISLIASSGSEITNIFYRKRYVRLSFTKHPNLQKHLPLIMKFFAAVVTQQIYVNSDIIMIGWMSTDHAVGLYSTASKVYNIINTLLASIFIVTLPQVSQSYGEGKYDRYNDILRKIILFLIGIGLPSVVGIMMIPKDIIVFISGPEYADASMALGIFSITLLFSFIHGFLGNMLAIPLGDFETGIWAASISSIVNVGLNLWLLPIFGFAVAAATTTVSEFFSALVFYIRLKGKVKIKIGNIEKSIVHSLIGCIAFTIYICIIETLPLGINVKTVTIIMGSAVIYATVLLIFKDEFATEAIKFIKRR